MISKNTIKLIRSLANKKYRLKENLFVVEGDKNVTEVLNSAYTVEKLFVTDTFFSRNKNICDKAISTFDVEHADIRNASLLKNPQNSIALCRLPVQIDHPKQLGNNISIYLDDIQDPGNLGTIIRICDWFKVEYLFLSPNTVDVYNPKTIQATMGSFCRVKTFKYSFDLVEELAQSSDTQIFGAFLDGKNIYQESLPSRAILVMGNEGNGIQKDIENRITKKIKIPEFSEGDNIAESLNVSVATAIICSEFKRSNFV